MSTRLERSRSGRMIAGVCAGIARYLEVDATWVRLAFALLAIFGGIGLLIYIVLVVIMPAEPQGAPAGTAAVAAEGADAGATAPLARLQDPEETERRRRFAGYALIAVGVIFLLNNQGVFRFLEWRYIWPLALVAVGVLLLVQRTRR